MSFDIVKESAKVIEYIDKIKSIVVESGNSSPDSAVEDAKKRREAKMYLIKLNVLSRRLFGELSRATKGVEEAMLNTNNALRNVHGLEMELSSLRHTIDNCKSFSMPEYEAVFANSQPVELTPEDGNKSLFEKQCEKLEEELNERKRIREELEEVTKLKRQRVLTSMHLKHKAQNVAYQQLEKLGDSFKRVAECYNNILESDDEDKESAPSTEQKDDDED